MLLFGEEKSDMLTNIEIIKKISEITEKDKRYKKEAFFFILSALEHTLSKLPARRHLSGQELAKGIAEYARSQYGYMAKMVLEKWGISKTIDYGEIVYLMINLEIMTKTEGDKKEDFADVYDFVEEFNFKHLNSSDFPERF